MLSKDLTLTLSFSLLVEDNFCVLLTEWSRSSRFVGMLAIVTFPFTRSELYSSSMKLRLANSTSEKLSTTEDDCLYSRSFLRHKRCFWSANTDQSLLQQVWFSFLSWLIMSCFYHKNREYPPKMQLNTSKYLQTHLNAAKYYTISSFHGRYIVSGLFCGVWRVAEWGVLSLW